VARAIDIENLYRHLSRKFLRKRLFGIAGGDLRFNVEMDLCDIERTAWIILFYFTRIFSP
jgi:hypothetical protein